MDVLVAPGRQSPAIVVAERLQALLVRPCLRDEERVDQQETVLDQLKAEGRAFWRRAAIGGHEALAAIAHKVMGCIPPFHHVQARVHLRTEGQSGSIRTAVNGFLPLAACCQGARRRMGHGIGVKALEHRVRGGRAPFQRHRRLNQLSLWRGHEVPTKRPAQDTCTVRKRLAPALRREVETCICDALHPWH
jgi:hypothetical protein